MQLLRGTMFKKIREMVMRKDARYELLEDRVRQLEDIIDELIVDVNEDIDVLKMKSIRLKKLLHLIMGYLYLKIFLLSLGD